MKMSMRFGMVLLLLVHFGVRAQVVLPMILPDTIGYYQLSVAERFTTNLVFPYPIFKVDIGSGDVIARKMGKTENILLLKANRAHFAPMNVSVYLENGRLYSFRVEYADSLSRFNYSFREDAVAGVPRCDAAAADVRGLGAVGGASQVIFSGMPADAGRLRRDAVSMKKSKRFLRVRASAGKVRLGLRGVYVKDSLLWLDFGARNRSLIAFRPRLLRFSLEDSKRVRRTAVQSIEVEPVYADAPEVITGDKSTRWVAGFTPFTLTRGKRLVVEWSEPGGRRIRLSIKGKHILKARVFK